jgi:phenylacetate-CoA ligase
VLGRAGIDDAAHGLASIYGTADAAILGHETPESIALRRRLADEPALARTLFHDERLPMLFQVHPYFKYFEAINGELIVTTRGGLPLVRYNIHDEGGILPPETAASVGAIGLPLPYLYLYGRRNLGCNLYSVNIYWENLRSACEDPEISHLVTGKFSSSVVEDRDLNPVWKLFVELARGVAPTESIREEIGRAIVRGLREQNSEYRRQHAASGKKIEPLIILFTHGDPLFSIGAKLTWKQCP